MKKITFLSSFWIKIIAIVFMTMDHLGIYFKLQFPNVPSLIELSNIFRIFGRLSLPLFAFLIVEGVLHTKNIKKYLLRLGIVGSVVSIPFILFDFTNLFPNAESIYRHGNIFIDLVLTAIAVYFVMHKNKKLRLITLLPVAYSILSFVVKGVETSIKIEIKWFPYFLTMQYDWVTVALGLGFFFAYYFARFYLSYLENKSGIDKDIWIDNGSYRLIVNLFSILFLIIVILIQYAMGFVWNDALFWDAGVQLYAIVSGAFILLYNGKRGYNAKWFQYGSYLYYPIHIIIIAVIFIIQNGGL